MRYNSAMGAFKFSVALRLILVSSMIYCCFGESVELKQNQFCGNKYEANSTSSCSLAPTANEDIFKVRGCKVLFRTSDCSLRGYIVWSKEHARRMLFYKGLSYAYRINNVNSLRKCTEWERRTNAFQVGIDMPATAPTYEYPTQPHHSTKLWELFTYLSKNGMENFVSNFSSFHSRDSQYFDGPDTAEGWINQQIRTVADSYTNGSISIKKVASPAVGNVKAYNQENIIVKLEGHDPALKNEVVILGAHYDSININHTLDGDGAPGADDNATGCAVLLEVLRLIAQFGIQFKRTVEFHWYAAGENGLWGSQDVVEEYLVSKTIVKGMLNLNTLGYQPSEKEKDIKIFTDNTDRTLTAFVEMLIRHYLPEYGIKRGACLRNCSSDHASWNFDGYPAVYVAASELTPNIHTSQDTIDKVNFEQVKEFAKLAVAFVSELGDLVEISDTPDASSSSIPLKDWGAIMIGLAVIFCFWRGVNYYFVQLCERL